MPFSAHVAEADGTTTAFGIMLPEETAWVDVERAGDLEFLVRAAGRAGAVGLRIVSGQPVTHDGNSAASGSVDVQFGITPESAAGSITPVGHQLHVSWSGDQIEVRVTIADRR